MNESIVKRRKSEEQEMELIGNIPGKGPARIRIDDNHIYKIQIKGAEDTQHPHIGQGFIDI